MAGSPAGLAAIDKLFGVDLYTSTFTASPMVFGAMPSLHSACATLEALFMSYNFPRMRSIFVAYTLWMWWSTMYLSHHYAIDLVAGSLIAAVAYFVCTASFLPQLQPDKIFELQYGLHRHDKEFWHNTASHKILDIESYPLHRQKSDDSPCG